MGLYFVEVPTLKGNKPDIFYLRTYQGKIRSKKIHVIFGKEICLDKMYIAYLKKIMKNAGGRVVIIEKNSNEITSTSFENHPVNRR